MTAITSLTAIMNTSFEQLIVRNFKDKLFQALCGVIRIHNLELIKGDEYQSCGNVIIYIQALKSFETILSFKVIFMGSDTLLIKAIKSIIKYEILEEFCFGYDDDKSIQMFLEKISDLLESHFYKPTLYDLPIVSPESDT
ncbi:MAG: hypothetical protein KME55_34055 [Nostoc indistinguendum CM1-VF10]|jgi:hypothetical protein|nr:hypothetical protein [Nostoc indistinguendum CM1-VF10]